MSFHTKKQKKKILIPNKFYVSFNLALLKKELMLKSTIHVGWWILTRSYIVTLLLKIIDRCSPQRSTIVHILFENVLPVTHDTENQFCNSVGW